MAVSAPGQNGAPNFSQSTPATNQSSTNEDRETITTFFDDHQQPVNEPESPTVPSMIQTMDYNHSLLEILRRPVAIHKLSITSTQDRVLENDLSAPQPFLFQIPLPSTLVGIASKIVKLYNFEYLEANIKIKLTINANPLVTGKYLLVYSPYEDTISETRKLINQSLTTITGFPSCYLDPQLDVSTEFTIPYLGMKEAYSLTRESEDYCTLSLFAVVPTRNVSETSPVVFTVYANLEDIKLYGPTTQLPSITYRKNIIANLQVKSNISKKGENGKPQGMVSKIATNVGNLANSLGGIPLLNQITEPISWVSSVVGKVADIFGWAKPIQKNEISFVSQNPGMNMTHITAIDNSTSLAMNQDYKLAPPTNIFQTNTDEMEIEYICNNPTIIQKYQWSNTTRFRQIIEVSARSVNQRTPESYYINTPFQFLAKFFKMFRATFVYNISFAKTAFHSGRMEIFFVPYNSFTIPSFNDDTDPSMAFRTVLDITNDTEVTVRIPFVLDKLFGDMNLDCLGYLVLQELNPLVSSSTVESIVDVVVYHYCENVLFTHPVVRNTYSVTSANKYRKMIGKLQINLTNKQSDNVVTFFTEGDEHALNMEALKTVSGDHISNMRNLCRAFRYIERFTTPSHVFSPLDDREGKDYISLLSYLYRMFHGGFRIKALSNSDSTTVIRSELNINGEPSNNYAPFNYTFTQLNAVHEVSIPFYSTVRRLVMGVPNIDKYYPDQLTLYTNSLSDKNDVSLYRAGDDDFTFGWMIGAPSLIINTNSPPNFNTHLALNNVVLPDVTIPDITVPIGLRNLIDAAPLQSIFIGMVKLDGETNGFLSTFTIRIIAGISTMYFRRASADQSNFPIDTKVSIGLDSLIYPSSAMEIYGASGGGANSISGIYPLNRDQLFYAVPDLPDPSGMIYPPVS